MLRNFLSARGSSRIAFFGISTFSPLIGACIGPRGVAAATTFAGAFTRGGALVDPPAVSVHAPSGSPAMLKWPDASVRADFFTDPHVISTVIPLATTWPV